MYIYVHTTHTLMHFVDLGSRSRVTSELCHLSEYILGFVFAFIAL